MSARPTLRTRINESPENSVRLKQAGNPVPAFAPGYARIDPYFGMIYGQLIIKMERQI